MIENLESIKKLLLKAFCLIVLLSLYAIVAISQVVAIQNDMQNSLRLCIDNHLTVAVEGLAAADILLSTNNGSIEKDTYNVAGHYIYKAKFVGTAIIYVKKRIGDSVESIDSVKFRVQRMPILPTKFAGKSDGQSIDHLMVLAQLGIIVPSDVHGDRRFQVSSFSLVIYRGNREIFNRKILGPKIDQETNNFFYTLKNNDKLKFENIHVKDCDGELRQAGPIQLILKNAVSYKKVKDADTIFVEDPVTGEILINRRDSIWKR